MMNDGCRFLIRRFEGEKEGERGGECREFVGVGQKIEWRYVFAKHGIIGRNRMHRYDSANKGSKREKAPKTTVFRQAIWVFANIRTDEVED